MAACVQPYAHTASLLSVFLNGGPGEGSAVWWQISQSEQPRELVHQHPSLTQHRTERPGREFAVERDNDRGVTASELAVTPALADVLEAGLP